MEKKGSRVQGHPWLHNKFEVSHIRLCLKKEKQINKWISKELSLWRELRQSTSLGSCVQEWQGHRVEAVETRRECGRSWDAGVCEQ